MLKELSENFEKEIVSIKKNIEAIKKVRNEEYNNQNEEYTRINWISNLEDKVEENNIYNSKKKRKEG